MRQHVNMSIVPMERERDHGQREIGFLFCLTESPSTVSHTSFLSHPSNPTSQAKNRSRTKKREEKPGISCSTYSCSKVFANRLILDSLVVVSSSTHELLGALLGRSGLLVLVVVGSSSGGLLGALLAGRSGLALGLGSGGGDGSTGDGVC